MADLASRSTSNQSENDSKKQLKYLDFVQVASIYVFVCCSTIYEYAKENSGPLRPGAEAVEGTVKTVIEPVYQKFHDVPFELVKFIDRKVGESITQLGAHVPLLFKQVTIQICTVAEKAPEVAGELVSDVQHIGLVKTASNVMKTVYYKYEPTAKELYAKYEPVAEHHAVMTWRMLNRLSLFPQVADIMVPTATYWVEKYNQVVVCMADRGYAVSYYLPLVPIERIAKAFEGCENEPGFVNGEYVAVPQ